MVNCDFSNSGCEGGMLTNSLLYLVGHGIATEECLPYANQLNYCMYRCDDPSIPYKKYGCIGGTFKIATNHVDIMRELMANGPMMVAMEIYEDFMSYAGGIYQYTDGEHSGAHAVKIIGWNHDADGNLYWICQNQWATDWGESGYFNIYAGELGLDSAAYACMPNV